MELSGGAGVKLAAHAIRSALDAQSVATQGLSLKEKALGSNGNAGLEPAAKITISDAGRLSLQENGAAAARDEGLREDNIVTADRERLAEERSGNLDPIESAAGETSDGHRGVAADQPEGISGLLDSYGSSSKQSRLQSVNLLA